MSITSSLHNAMSGLTAAGRAAEIVASNVSNALTDGYGRRELDLSSKSVAGNGAGVRIDGVTRHVDTHVISERRLADASVALTSERGEFYARMERAIGLPDEDGSLTNRIADFEASLLEAASMPESDTRLGLVLSKAQGFADHLNNASNEVQSIRMDADKSIGRQIEFLNEGLQRVVDYNVEIQQQLTSGRDATALFDQRQVLIDQIAEIVPVKEVPRKNGQVSLYSPGGAVLVDSKAAVLGFSSVGVITADMTQASGALSGLTINGQPTTTSSARSPIEGGSLAALFEVRDELAPKAQEQLDAVARDMIERFASSGVDPSLGPTDPGLFTDGGAALDPLDEVGLAGRISINGLADPAQGGDLWRLRAGLGAATAGESGDSTMLYAMIDALDQGRVAASGGFSPTSRNAATLASDFISVLGTARNSNDAETAYVTSQATTLKTLELGDGVDTDRELQNLLLIEQAFSANAKVISTVDELINQLLRI